MYYTKELENQYRVQFDNELKVLAATEEISIVPEDYGFPPIYYPITCILYEGWYGIYTLGDNIILNELYIISDNVYPPLNGVLPSGEDDFGNRIYKDVGLKIPYTGKVLVAKTPVERYKLYRDATRHRAWAYTTLIELVYENGSLVSKNDISHIGEWIRRGFASESGFVKRYYSSLKLDRGKTMFMDEFRTDVWWT